MTTNVIGALRHRVTIERPERTAEGGGGATIAGTEVATVFARIETASGREISLADGRQGRATHKILLRWRADVEPQMRFTCEGRHFDIRAVLDTDGRRRWLTCLSEEQLP